MKKLLVPLAAAGLFLGSTAIVAAQSSNSAKDFAPGQQDRLPGDRGASSNAPGQLQTSPGDAKNFAPGQKKETTGSAGTTMSKEPKGKDKTK
jgi:hypothetical protein